MDFSFLILNFFKFISNNKTHAFNCHHELDIEITCEWHNHNLELEIAKRKLHENPFTEDSLWHLLAVLMDLISYFAKNQTVSIYQI